MNSKPQIRFRQFSDDWKEKELNEVSERITRKNDNLESTLPLTISAQNGLVDQRKFFKAQIASKDVSGYFLLKKGEFAYNKSYSSEYPLGAIKRLDNYDMGVLSTLYIVFACKNINSDFLLNYYDSNYWHKEIIKIAAEGARNHGLLNIAPQDFFNTKLMIPPAVPEQAAIGAFFNRISSLVSLAEQKLEKTVLVKKSLLEKMFPKGAQRVPEVRFKGFSGDWEEKKLGEICCLFDYGLNSASTRFDGIHKYLRITDIDDEIRVFKKDDITSPKVDFDNCADSILKDKDIVFARTGASVGKTYLYNKDDGLVYFAGFLIRARVKNEFDEQFIFQNTLTMNYKKFIKATSQRSGQPGVNSEEYKEYSFLLPSLPEQQKIGRFFAQMDKTIFYYRAELEKLRTLKKSLLEKMFV